MPFLSQLVFVEQSGSSCVVSAFHKALRALVWLTSAPHLTYGPVHCDVSWLSWPCGSGTSQPVPSPGAAVSQPLHLAQGSSDLLPS